MYVAMFNYLKTYYFLLSKLGVTQLEESNKADSTNMFAPPPE